MYFAYEAINTCTSVLNNFEKWMEKRNVHQFILSLEILAIIPLYDGVLKLTNPVSVTIDLQNSVHYSPLLAVVRVGQHVVCARLR